MTEVRFYHLMTKTVEEALPAILSKALEQKRRAVIRLPDESAMKKLDEILWTYDPDSFLPHGMAKDDFAEDQPVCLTVNDENPNKADILILTGGTKNADLAPYSLCCVMVDGRDEQSVAGSREDWKLYKNQGLNLTYWQQNDKGGWEKKAA